MRRSQRLIAAAVLVALTSALGGCSSGFGSWDPTDLLDFLDTKKKLPGERKPASATLTKGRITRCFLG